MKNSWSTKKLGEVLDICDSGTWGDELSSGMPLLRSSNMQDGQLVLEDLKFIDVPKDKMERYTLREGDILITKSSGSVNHIGKSLFITKEMDGKYGFSNFTQRLRVNERLALSKWVYLKISNPATRNFLLGASQTTTGLRNLKISALNELEIPLPPIAEQKKIVARVEKLLAKVKEAKRLRAEARAAAQSLLSAELHKIFEEGKKKGWEEKELEKISESVADGTHDTPKYHFQGFPLITSKNLRSEGLFFDTAKFISEEDYTEINKRSVVSNGDILIGMIGTIGNITKVKTDRKFSIKNVGLIRPNNKKVLADYILYYLDNSRLFDLIIIGGTTQKFMSLGMLRKIKIKFPILSEQKKIVARLDALSAKLKKIEEYQKSAESNLDRLEQSILHRAFAGRW